MSIVIRKTVSLGVLDREFRGKEQQEKPRVREFRKLWIASLRGLSVPIFISKKFVWYVSVKNPL